MTDDPVEKFYRDRFRYDSTAEAKIRDLRALARQAAEEVRNKVPHFVQNADSNTIYIASDPNHLTWGSGNQYDCARLGGACADLPEWVKER